MKEYEEIRRNLIEMLEDLDERLAKITDHVKHADEPLEKDFAEQVTQKEDDEVQDYLGNVTRAEIEKVKQAIARIDSGEYGICVVCGESINKERLKALPYSTMCIKCASQKADQSRRR